MFGLFVNESLMLGTFQDVRSPQIGSFPQITGIRKALIWVFHDICSGRVGWGDGRG